MEKKSGQIESFDGSHVWAEQNKLHFYGELESTAVYELVRIKYKRHCCDVRLAVCIFRFNLNVNVCGGSGGFARSR